MSKIKNKKLKIKLKMDMNFKKKKPLEKATPKMATHVQLH